MKSRMILKDEHGYDAHVNWMKDLHVVKDCEIWVKFPYIRNEDGKEKYAVHVFERLICLCKNKHDAFLKIREIQEKLDEE